MNRVVVDSKIGSDGVLHLALPFGADSADQEVRVTVEPVAVPPAAIDEWRRRILATGGKWQGDLNRPEQGEVEIRESFN